MSSNRKTDLSHYCNTALLVVSQLQIIGKVNASKVARALKLSRYYTKQLLTTLWQEKLIGMSEDTIFLTNKGELALTPSDKIRASWHLDLIHGIKRDADN